MKRINNFFFSSQSSDKNFLTFFRISIGTFCIIRLLSIRQDFALLYGKNGIIPSEVQELFKTSFIPSITNISDFLSNHFGFTEQTGLFVFQAAYIFFAVFLIIGFFTRSSALGLLVLHLIMAKGTHLYSYGVDYFTLITIFYCCIFPVGYRNSVDEKLFKTRAVNPTPYRRLLQLHLCMIYFFSGLDKLMGFNWWNGESIWKAIHLPFFNLDFALDFSFMATYPIIPITIGWVTILAELLYAFLIWKQPYKNVALTLVVGMHLGIAVVMNLYFFSAIMIILNLAAQLNFAEKKIVIDKNRTLWWQSIFRKKYAVTTNSEDWVTPSV